ncbi:Cytochrome c-type biogenesis protein CcdA (DsbD analog) [hydrothermal vent metagenome]|uniref:Cytochrome c-type biogenesis protein CcdA (DsbD analog) n=1 Tax=hydrothermal vent metagenome TaxID=652676 RepID=A0A3B0WD67_9ZZZZ
MNELLILVAATLGALAFFEPCTIATHTLFSVRAHNKKPMARLQDVFIIWSVRSLLLISLFVLATQLSGASEINTTTASIVLMVMGSVYLISRKIYLPVPHLEFFRLLPFSSKLPDAVRLGLTAPACTLPLLVILIVLVVSVNSLSLAIISALLFATLFSLPIFVAATTGINESGKDFLSKAANGTPYLTAVLLFSAAAYLMFPEIDLSRQTLQETFQQASLTGLGLAFLAGFVFSFNPVSFTSIPVVLAYVTRAHEKRQALSLGAAFVFGLIFTHVMLGIVAASGGEWVQNIMGREWGLFLGPLLIVTGLMWTGWLKIKLPWFSMRGKKVTGHSGAFLLAIPFSVAICPFCAPALLVALTVSAAVGSVTFGALLLLAFALGRSIPILLGAWSMGWLESLQVVSRHHHVFEIIGGITLVFMGLYMLNEYLFII